MAEFGTNRCLCFQGWQPVSAKENADFDRQCFRFSILQVRHPPVATASHRAGASLFLFCLLLKVCLVHLTFPAHVLMLLPHPHSTPAWFRFVYVASHTAFLVPAFAPQRFMAACKPCASVLYGPISLSTWLTLHGFSEEFFIFRLCVLTPPNPYSSLPLPHIHPTPSQHHPALTLTSSPLA